MRIMGYLTDEKRKKIKLMLECGMSIQSIAKEIGACRQTVYNELRRGKNENGIYDPQYAERLYQTQQENKGRTAILEANQDLALRISHLILSYQYSPERIIKILKEESSIAPSAPLSVNTIYAAIDNGLIPEVTRDSLRANKTKMFSNGMVCIPKWIRDDFGFCDGDIFSIEVQNDGTISLRKSNRTTE